MYILVSPFSKSFDDIGLIYFVPDFLTKPIILGIIVEIPIKNDIEIGVIFNIIDKNEVKKYISDESKIKSIIGIKNSNTFLDNNRLKLSKWISSYYFTSISNSLNLFIPKNLRAKILNGKINLDNINEYNYTFKYNTTLTSKQNEVYQVISKSSAKVLLHGLTGSGKTEIYIKLIREALNKGKQSLFLIPEIILTNQLSNKIRDIFGDDILIINSTVPDAKKTKYWIDINSGNAKIIIGTRSALFYPYNNLGLIIIDEEHDNSYKSDSSPRYNGIEVAEKITELYGNKLILGSGTPSVNSMYKGLKGEYKIVSLLEKYKK